MKSFAVNTRGSASCFAPQANGICAPGLVTICAAILQLRCLQIRFVKRLGMQHNISTMPSVISCVDVWTPRLRVS